MPLVIAGVLLLPFHLSWVAFTPMQYGVDILLWLANFVAHLPWAMSIVPNPTDAGFAVALLEGIWIYFWKTRIRWAGVALVIAGMSTAFLYVPPDIFIGADGKHVAVRLDDGHTAMIRGKATSVMAQSWARAATAHALLEKKDAPLRCDAKGCVISAHGHTIAALKNADAVAEECLLSDVVIVSENVPSGSCAVSLLIDASLLNKTGATTVWLGANGWRVRHARQEQGNRPWAGRTSAGRGIDFSVALLPPEQAFGDDFPAVINLQGVAFFTS